MPKRAFRYVVVDAFTDAPFKGNSAAVCLLEDDAGDGGEPLDERWLQAVAAEFNTPITAFLTRSASSGAGAAAAVTAQFRIRNLEKTYFTLLIVQSELCGHGTLAAAHYLIASGLVESDAIEFVAKSGRLTAKKVFASKDACPSAQNTCSKFMIELDFPVIPVAKCNSAEMVSIPQTLNGASVINELQTVSAFTDLIVEVSSCDEVDNVSPNTAELVQFPGRGVAITGPAREGSSCDFVTRFFSPKYGINEDPVCASVHCSLAPYWGKKLGKQNMTAFMASPRSGTLYLHWDEEAQRVQIRGEAVTVMVGSLLA
ncbi:hypothetical protein HU200_018392 [Digitaria exilis]|uniref:Uncharacterized protein n=1 Tax=Digitaria exilis TaxID=1010633 RepID=A0A835KHH9_9POAL|nr:hypothetical protein HU200_018392 [Digitaria exilis]